MKAERTNGETLIWVQSLKGYGQATLKSAKSFMHFDGDCRQLKSWKERFLMEHKKIQDKVNSADSAFIFLIIQSQNQWSGRRRRPCLVWSLPER